MSTTNDSARAEAFLKQLQARLETLPPPEQLTTELDRAVGERDPKRDTHLFRREAAFVNLHVVPHLFDLIQQPAYLGANGERARQALRNESLRGMEEYAVETGAWLAKHPFSKHWPGPPEKVYSDWTSGKGLRDSWPDILLSDPNLPRVVFECKYFTGGTAAAAQHCLVTSLYESCFYRGLPPLGETTRHSAWTCDFACLVAYDASDGKLVNAWKALPDSVRSAFWDGARVYPIIFSGQGGGSQEKP
ncbi:MAG: hypothetical protein ACYCSY_11575 [Acidiferrobacter sp.]